MLHFKVKTVIIMSFLSTILSCKEKAPVVTGPDFYKPLTSSIHLDDGLSFDYSLPGNMSQSFGQLEKHEQAGHTKAVSYKNSNDYIKFQWREALFIDGAQWDYTGPKSVGLGGELGGITLRIEINQFSFTDVTEESVLSDIRNKYIEFINGANGYNTNIIRDNPDEDRENLESLFMAIPDDFYWREVNDVRLLTWTSPEHPGNNIRYFIYALSKQHFLSFYFHSNTSIGDTKYRQVVNGEIVKVIDGIIDSLHIDAKK